jgi:Trehalose-phosphatase
MDIYVKRTHGTYIEEKGSAMLWQFRDADPEFGFLQSKVSQDSIKLHIILYYVRDQWSRVKFVYFLVHTGRTHAEYCVLCKLRSIASYGI